MSGGATVFSLEDVETRRPSREVVSELATAAAEEFPQKYRLRAHRSAPLLVRESITSYPEDPRVTRIRAMALRVIRFTSNPALGVSVGNYFSGLVKGTMEPGLERWKRRASEIAWQDHISLVREFILDLEEAGWLLPVLQATNYHARPVHYRNGQGTYTDPAIKPSRLARKPLFRGGNIRLSIVDPEHALRVNSARGLHAKLSSFSSNQVNVSQQAAVGLKGADADVLRLIVLPDARQLAPNDQIIGEIAALEHAGARFQVCRAESLRNRFATTNIAFALSLQAGCIPWTTELHAHRKIVALDAGHAPAMQQSRWCAAEYDTANQGLALASHDGELKENLTRSTLGALLHRAGNSATEVWRDGRWHRDDRRWLKQLSPGAESFELTKDPGVVLFRGDFNTPGIPQFGDAIQYEPGEWLIQTMEAVGSDGYRMPIRARGQCDESFVDDLIALCRRPTQSLYQASRLPVPVYWADRASKLSLSGWLRAVGHGWQLPPPFGAPTP